MSAVGGVEVADEVNTKERVFRIDSDRLADGQRSRERPIMFAALRRR